MKIKLTRLQREIVIWMIFFSVCAISGLIYVNTLENDHEGIIRLHILASSDSKEDQALKLKVRDKVIQYMEGQESIEESREYIESHLDDIEEIANGVIAAEGFEYKAKARLGVFFIPEKCYEDLTLPAGNYEALRITLGKGQGMNWWCVIFPNLCLIDEDAVDEEGEESEDPDRSSDRIILKSKVKEKIKSIMNQ
ncbi:MAG: stage II sporulation protein R [Eubacteriaceae bacterium]|nr:stage II sporulation protein R [Eubacteriaceae bacterium]